MSENLTPRSDELTQHIAKVMAQYLEGAITSPEACINILVTLQNWENEVIDENGALIRSWELAHGK